MSMMRLARQRVLAREGVMYGSFGGLQTSGLEAGGLDHARPYARRPRYR